MNRNVVVAVVAALFLGVLAGVVLGQVGGGPSAWVGAVGGKESMRAADAPRKQAAAPGDMAFDRLRIDVSGETPVACLEFTKPLSTNANVNFADFVSLEPAARPRFEAVGQSLCMRGLPYDEERTVTVREGLPAADGSATRIDETFALNFGDRPAFVGFAGSGIILPRAEADGVGIETVNVSRLRVEVLRVSDRILSQRTMDSGAAVAEGSWDSWTVDGEASDVGVSIFKGEVDVTGAERAADGGASLRPEQRNRTLTTVFPLGTVLKPRDPGAYVIRVYDASAGAGARGENADRPASAVRWIMYTDLALQTFSGATGLDVVVRSLKTARTEGGVTLKLVAENNDVLAEARSNGEGRARFASALMKGEGPLRARYVMAYGRTGDFAALDLQRGALDLSERDVGGRPAPGDVDAFMYTERGVYRPGEVVWINGMLRDAAGRALTNRASTLVIYRPNGTEFLRQRQLPAKEAGAVSRRIPLDRAAPRGQWRATLEVDGQETPAGEVRFAVEDFVPQRLRVSIEGAADPLGAGGVRPISVDAQFLYGAPGSGLAVEGEARLQPDPNPFPELQGYRFGVAGEMFEERFITLPSTVTDGAGKAELRFALDETPDTTLPLRARVVARVAEPGGRMVSESFNIPVRLSPLYVGVKPGFDEAVASGKPAQFQLAALDRTGKRVAANVSWRVVEEDWSYDWYLEGGQWKWRRTGRDIQVAGAQGTAKIGAGEPFTVQQADLRDGQYRLIVSQNDEQLASVRFRVGWGGDTDADTPDTVSIIARNAPVKAGQDLEVDIRPPYAGEAQIVVATDRVLSMQTERIPAAGKKLRIRADKDWGAGAYVLVTLMTPRDPAGRDETPVVPRRAVGVVYAPIDTGARKLEVAVGEGLGVVRPRQRLEIPVTVKNAPGGEAVRVTLAAVDEGILQLTKYKTPDPADHYFGRRALGVDIRDDYGRLLNPNLGAPARPRPGGDSLGGEGLTVVPTKTVALWSGLVRLKNGSGKIPLEVPDFNGELRLVAVAFTENAVGSGAAPVTVRDPVVADLTLPRFLAPGDEAFATLRLDNIEGESGDYFVSFKAGGATATSVGDQRVRLNRGANATLRFPLSATALGFGKVTMNLRGPNLQLSQNFDIQTRAPYLPVTQVSLEQQSPGVSYSLSRDVFSPFRTETATALVSYSPFAGLDPVPLLAALERYPYGCTEQLVSVAMPLLYANEIGAEAGAKADRQLSPRVQEAITRVLDRQSADGAFGLWRAGDTQASPWLGAYAVDFLRRAREAGYAVPAGAMEDAYKGLRAVARLDDFASVGYDFDVYEWRGNPDNKELLRSRASAYALYVLAKAGKADVGQVRYFHDARLAKEPSPLARAQIGAAMAHLGDRARAANAFRMAEKALGYQNAGDYYQSAVRDTAGVLALAAESGLTEMVARLNRRLAADAPKANELTTQEQAQLLLAANALLRGAGPVQVSVNGGTAGPVQGYVTRWALLERPATFRNASDKPVWRSLTITGAPLAPPGAASEGYYIDKRLFQMNGAPADPRSLRQGDRVIVALTGGPGGERLHPSVLVDLLPAGLEIESVLTPADGEGVVGWDGARNDGPFAWLGRIHATHVAEKRDDRFVAAFDLRGEGFTVAYVARAVTPGDYALPGAMIEDMYRPGVYGRSEVRSLSIAPR